MAAEVKTSLPTNKQFMASGCINFGQIIVGHTIGWIAPALSRLQNPEETPLDRVISGTEAWWMLFITHFGIIVAPLISGYLCNMVGRKPCLYFGGTALFTSYIMMAFSKHLVPIYIARLLAGVGIGVLFVTNLVFVTELASSKFRGTLLTLTGMSTTQGILTVYSVGKNFSYTITNGVVAFLCAEYVALIYFLVPESPVYQDMKVSGEEIEATALTELGRPAEVDEVLAQSKEKPKPKLAQVTELYTEISNRKAAILIICLNILTQFNGVVVVLAFVSYVVEMTGSDITAHLSSTIIGVTQLIVSIIAPLFVYKLGRKMLLLTSCAVCSFTLFCLGTYFCLYSNNYSIALNSKWLSVVLIMVFCAAYYGGMGFIPNTFAGEMFTDTCRSFGVTVIVTISWLFGFRVSAVFGVILTAWGSSVIFWIFSAICVFALYFTAVFVPEIKGQSMSEIRELLSR